MFRRLSLAVAIALLAGLPQLKAADPPADEFLPFRSVRIVRDLAEFSILNLKPQETGAWIVAEIRPGGSSGGLHMQGGYLKAETGEFVDNGIRPSLVVLVGGQWKRLDLLSGDAPRVGRFEWKEPHVERSFDRSFSIYDYYGVFTAANTKAAVICQFFADKSGAQQFASVTAIPDGWTTFVKPAYEYHVQHPADFTDSDLNGLRKLAAGENPFIALTAIRQLLSRSTTADEIDQLVDLARSLPKIRQAVLAFWLLKQDDDNARDLVLKTISRSKNAAELRGIALGIESWTASQGQTIPDRKPILNLRDKVTEKWQSFDPSPANDEPSKSWRKILFAPSIPEGKSNQTNE